MLRAVVELSKYILVFNILLYTLLSFITLRRDDSRRHSVTFVVQDIIIFANHMTGSLVLLSSRQDLTYFFLPLFQVIVVFAFIVLTRAIYPRSNRLVLNHTAMLLSISFVILTRLSITRSIRQFVIIAISMAVALIIPYFMKYIEFIKKCEPAYVVAGIAILGAVLISGSISNGSKLAFSILGVSFQPSEFVKIIYVLFIAGMLSRAKNFGHIALSAALAAAHVLILAFSKDLGSALIYFSVYTVLLFVTTKKLRYMLLGLIGGGVASVAAYFMFSHVRVRVQAWLDPWTDIDSKGYQIAQSLFGIGTGGWFGMGIDAGTPSSIPYVEQDFIFSAICEEYGVIFGICLIAICVNLFLEIVHIAKTSYEPFIKYSVYGLGIVYIVQLFLTIGGNSKFVPLTGVTLPLISYGGSSVLATLIMLAVVQGFYINKDYASEFLGEYDDGGEYGEYDEGDGYSQDYEYDNSMQYYNENGYIYGNPNATQYDNAQYDNNNYADNANGSYYNDLQYNESPCNDESASYNDEESAYSGDDYNNNEAYYSREPQMTVIAGVFSLLFVAISVYLAHFVQYDSTQVINNSYNAKRQEILASQTTRGDILSSDGEVLATTLANSDERYYPYDNIFSHAIGYADKGRMGVELNANIYLVSSNISLNDKLQDAISNEKYMGNTVITTFDSNLQKAAYNALGAYDGAIIVMEPSTGKILAMVSKPDFNPNDIDDIWDSIINDADSSVLVNRVTQGLYPPGSTFKILTALEYIRENPTDYASYSFNCTGRFTSGENTINCFHGTTHGEVDFTQSFAKSCNSSFANIGLSLDRKSFLKTLDRLYFNKPLPVDMLTNKSAVAGNIEDSDSSMIQTVIGQGETQITPLHLAMITSMIANNGVMMTPYTIDRVENANDEIIKQFEPSEIGQLITSDEASALDALMKAVVEEGTGTRLKGLEYGAAGKTGSAEYNKNSDSHAWFTGYTYDTDYPLQITVIMEGAGSGGEYAVPVARRVLDEYYADK